MIGLQTALTLLENGYGVTIVAKHWPGDDDINYASMKLVSLCLPSPCGWGAAAFYTI